MLNTENGESRTSRLCRALFPFVDTLRGYTRVDVRADLMAAATVAVVASPQSMAYAVIAGVEPVYGLYASILPVIVAALWGSSRYLLAGPTNAVSMILASSMAQITMIAAVPPEQYLIWLFTLTFLVGVIQLLMGLARLGELSNFISHAVVQAFTVGASILIVLGQIPNLLGLDFHAPPGTWEQIKGTVQHLPQTHVWSLGIGLFTLGLAVLVGRVRPRWPGTLLALTASACLAAILDLGERGVELAGAIPRGLPPLSLPPGLNIEHWKVLLPPALSIALLGAVETLAIARTLAARKGESLDGSQELIGQGLGNMAAGLTSGIAGCGSFGRSAVNFAAGARTRMAAALSGVLTLAAVLALGPLVKYIPIPSLAALLLLICRSMIHLEDIRFTLRATRGDAVVWAVTLTCVLVFDLETAVFAGVILSLILFLRRQAHPRVEILARHMLPLDQQWLVTCPHIAAFRLEGPLFFGAVGEVESALCRYDLCQRLVILHMNRVGMMDATGAAALRSFLRRCAGRGVKVIVCWSHPDVRDTITRTGLSRGKRGCYLTGNMEAASLLATTLLLESCACQTCLEDCRGCEHGRRAVGELPPGSLSECQPVHRPEEDLPSPALDMPAPNAGSLDMLDSPSALLDGIQHPTKPFPACPLPAPTSEKKENDALQTTPHKQEEKI